MPLRVIDGDSGEPIHSWELDDRAWELLAERNRQRRHLSMPCCHAHVVLRRSIHGTQHFVHKKRGPCTTAPESAEHIELKLIVARTAQQCGWTAATEVSGQSPNGEQWVADVLLSKGKARIAVEVQLSPQTDEELSLIHI